MRNEAQALFCPRTEAAEAQRVSDLPKKVLRTRPRPRAGIRPLGFNSQLSLMLHDSLSLFGNRKMSKIY